MHIYLVFIWLIKLKFSLWLSHVRSRFLASEHGLQFSIQLSNRNVLSHISSGSSGGGSGVQLTAGLYAYKDLLSSVQMNETLPHCAWTDSKKSLLLPSKYAPFDNTGMRTVNQIFHTFLIGLSSRDGL